MTETSDLSVHQTWPLPSNPQPIVIIGAGGIVNDAHLPAYQKAEFPVSGIYDVNQAKGDATAKRFGIPNVFDSLEQACAMQDVVFDVAVPTTETIPILNTLPDDATVLIQKPMGDNLAMARDIRDICRRKGMAAAINHQLRFCPYVLAARSLIDQGEIGDLHAMEVRLTAYTPWHLWTFLEKVPRLEIQYHSIHYLDLIRSFFGEPLGVYCRTLKHPDSPKLASVRTMGMLEYGNGKMVGISINHSHAYGSRHQESFIKWEGTRGAIKTTMGLLMNYPKGVPDKFEYCIQKNGQEPTWQSLALEGTWFPDAFIGTMSNLQRFVAGEDQILHTNVEDAYHTMAVVEACHLSSASGSTPIKE
jgi:predicted dehydrogenase